MVYTSALHQMKQLGATVKLDHEYTSAVMTAVQLPKNCPIIIQPNSKFAQQIQQIQNQSNTNKIYQQQQQIKFYNTLSEKAKTALTRDCLANKLRQNWIDKNPSQQQSDQKCGGINLDDSLTSLGWLHGMNVMKSVSSPTPPPSPTPDTEVNPNSILTVVQNVQPAKPAFVQTADRVDYRANPYVKPPYSYATLICMAIKQTGVEKITLSSIYQWITENFMYYRIADPSWQNSIRHNLSLNKCFQKVPRRKDEPGKGGFWRINPEYNDLLVDGVLKKRRTSVNAYYPPIKRIKTEPDQDPWGKDRPAPVVPQQQIPERTFVINEGVSMNDLRNGNFSWNQLLNQDIMVGGVTIKTEDIIDDTVTCLEEEQQQESPVQQYQYLDMSVQETGSDSTAFTEIQMGELTPPSSGNSNSDNSLDEIFDFTTDYQNSPLDLSSSGLALDLTLQGVGLKAPQWWETPSDIQPPAGMHTPTHQSDSLDDWKTPRLSMEEAIEAFDIDNLFDTSS